jgi:auxin efflux carrier family
MVLKFLIGPVIMLLVSLAIGMHGTLLHISVVQVIKPTHEHTPLFYFVF